MERGRYPKPDSSVDLLLDDEDDVNGAAGSAPYLANNANTLETVSASSFVGFVRPRQREAGELVNRVRRHKSFFSSPSSKFAVNGSAAEDGRREFEGLTPAQKMAAAFR